MFRDRSDAGRRLAVDLAGVGLVEPVVLALPRGGVPVGFEVAGRLKAPLDVFVARKIGAPGQPEFGIGAVAEGGVAVSTSAVGQLGISSAQFQALAAAEHVDVDRRVERYRPGRECLDISGRDAVLVDDGLATGVTAEAALHALRARHPRRLLLAVPVAAPEAVDRLRPLTEGVVCVELPGDLRAVGDWYHDFRQTSDEEVIELLTRS